MSNEIKSADSLIGVLLNNGQETFFRVYGSNTVDGELTFSDYKIGHPDLFVQIIDVDAKIFPIDDENFDGVIDIGL